MAQFPIDIPINTSETRKLIPLNRELDKTDAAATGAASAVRGLGAALAAVGAGAVATQAIRAVARYESALVGVSKTTGLTGRNLDQLSKRIDALSRSIPVSTDELLGLAQAAGQMGVTGVDNLEKFAATVAKLGRASDLAGEQAASALARILNVTGENIGEIDTLASVIVSLGNNVAATEAEIARITTEVARSTSVFKVSSAQAAGLSAAFASIGVQAEIGGSSVGRTLQAINNAVQAGGSTLDQFARTLGLNGDALAEAFQEDKLRAFEMFLQAVNDLGLRAGNALDQVGLGGQEVAKTILPLANNLRVYAQTQQLANREVENATALNREFGATLDTFDSQFATATNIVADFSRILSTEFTNSLTDSLTAFNEWGADAENLADAVDTLGTIAASTAAVLGARLAGSLYTSTAAFIAAQRESIRYQATLASMAGVSGRAAAAQIALGSAARAASGAFALIGGPAGAVVLATFALVEYLDVSDDVAERQRELTNETDKLVQKFKEVNEAGKTALQTNLANEASALRQQFAQAGEEAARLEERVLQAAQSIGGVPQSLQTRYLEAVRESQRLEQALDAVTTKQQALFDAGIGDNWQKIGDAAGQAANATGDAAGQAGGAVSEYDKLTASLNEQRIALEASEQAAAIYAAMQKLGTDATNEQRQAIVEQINRIYELRGAQSGGVDNASRLENLRAEVEAYKQGGQAVAEFNARQALGAEATQTQVEQYARLATELERLREAQRGVNEETQYIDWEAFGNRASGAIASVASGVQSADDAIRTLAASIFQEVVGNLIQTQVVANLTNATTAASANSAMASTATTAAASAATTSATTSSIAAGIGATVAGLAGTVGAAWAPAAALASLATLGANAVPAQAAIISTVGTALAAQLVGGLISNVITAGTGFAAPTGKGFKQGGYTGDVGVNDVAGVVHGREYVMPAGQTSQYRSELDAMRNGSYTPRSSGMNVKIVNNISDRATVTTQQDANGGLIATIDERIGERVPGIMQNELTDPYSGSRQALDTTYNLERK